MRQHRPSPAREGSEIFPQYGIVAFGNFPYSVEYNDSLEEVQHSILVKRVLIGIAVDLQEGVFGFLFCLTLICCGKGELFPVLKYTLMGDSMSEIKFHMSVSPSF